MTRGEQQRPSDPDSDRRVVLRSYEGVLTTYTQPENPYSKCWCELCKAGQFGPNGGVGSLLSGQKLVLEPVGLPSPAYERRHALGGSTPFVTWLAGVPPRFRNCDSGVSTISLR